MRTIYELEKEIDRCHQWKWNEEDEGSVPVKPSELRHLLSIARTADEQKRRDLNEGKSYSMNDWRDAKTSSTTPLMRRVMLVCSEFQ